MKITLTKAIFSEMLAAAYEAVPHEACGLLAGTGGCVTKCYVLTNADASAEHFSMRPEEQFAAIKDMRHNGLHQHWGYCISEQAMSVRFAYSWGYDKIFGKGCEAPVLGFTHRI